MQGPSGAHGGRAWGGTESPRLRGGEQYPGEGSVARGCEKYSSRTGWGGGVRSCLASATWSRVLGPSG